MSQRNVQLRFRLQRVLEVLYLPYLHYGVFNSFDSSDGGDESFLKLPHHSKATSLESS